MTESRHSLPETHAQAVLDAATNGADKGAAQWFTPKPVAEWLARGLEPWRDCVVDLNCGAGALLHAALTKDVRGLLGADIDGREPAGVRHIRASLADLYPLLCEVEWEADCFVLNPPFGLNWPVKPFADLAASETPGVKAAMQTWLKTHGLDRTLDSALLTLLVALDRCSARGEGACIANASTMDRLIFAPGAPFNELAIHFWARVPVPRSEFPVGADLVALYFARGHTYGCKPSAHDGAGFPEPPNRLRRHGVAYNRHATRVEDTLERWKAVAEQVEANRKPRPHYHIGLDREGRIYTNLSRFETHSTRIDKALARRLHELNGRVPMQLVMQRADRDELLRAANDDGWRVDPNLPPVIHAAITAYHASRAPLAPLNQIQRLGYLDEQDRIRCVRDFESGGATFKAGASYPLRTRTIEATRHGKRPGLDGAPKDVSYTGRELAIFIKSGAVEVCFLSAHLKEGHTLTDGLKVGATLRELCDHFEIPEVPDAAACNPAEHARHLATIAALEKLNVPAGATDPEWIFRPFQKQDLATAALVDGLVLGWDKGLGKTLALFVWALLKLGYTLRRDPADNAAVLVPNGAVLLVVPGDLHAQVQAEAWEKFRIRPRQLRNLSDLDRYSRDGKVGPGFYLSSYQDVTLNGVKPWPVCPSQGDPWPFLTDWGVRRGAVAAWHASRGSRYANWYSILKATPGLSAGSLQVLARRAYERAADEPSRIAIGNALDALLPLHHPTMSNALFTDLPESQQSACARRMWHAHCEAAATVGQAPAGTRIFCSHSPTLSEMAAHSFDAVGLDEGVRLKGDDTKLGIGLRRLCPKYRLVLTGDPIKNRLPDVFWLAHWAAGGHEGPTARWPYAATIEDHEQFGDDFLVMETDVDAKKAHLKQNPGSRADKRFQRQTTIACNLHRIWKLLGPVLLRRRKDNCGEKIPGKLRHVISVPLGTAQAKVVKYHLTAKYLDAQGKPAMGARLAALRLASADPASENLVARPGGNHDGGTHRSPHGYTPRMAACLNVIAARLEARQQVIVFSCFKSPLRRLENLLHQAGVPIAIADGDAGPAGRAALVTRFKQGDRGNNPLPVLGATADSMAEGHSFTRVHHLVRFDLHWAMDRNNQLVDRIHRLTSAADANIYDLMCDGTIDPVLGNGFGEKRDTAELVLDGCLVGEPQQQLSIADLIGRSYEAFATVGDKTIDEADLSKTWPALRDRLRNAWQAWTAGLNPHPTAPAAPSELHSRRNVLGQLRVSH